MCEVVNARWVAGILPLRAAMALSALSGDEAGIVFSLRAEDCPKDSTEVMPDPMDDVVVGTVCVAPRARSGNRYVYFLELQGPDAESRHHVLCKATQLGGLLPDDTTVVVQDHTTPVTCTHHVSPMHVSRTGGTAQGPEAGRHAHGERGTARAVRWQAGPWANPLPPRHPCDHCRHLC